MLVKENQDKHAYVDQVKSLTDTINQQACEMKIYERDMMGRLKEVSRELRVTRAEAKKLGEDLTTKKDEIRQIKARLARSVFLSSAVM